MSDENNNEADTSCCASCGIAEIDDIKLVPCDGCDLVKYCSDECQRDHKSEHEDACKKRAAELHDELLFKQPKSTYLGDCPICSVPLSLDLSKSGMYQCCSKVICRGCSFANKKRQVEMRIQQTCPFCREAMPETYEEAMKLSMKRIEANDPVAIRKEGSEQYNKGAHNSAFEYYLRAAELGDAEAQLKLARMYFNSTGVEKDEGKAIYHLEEAAIGGHPEARFNLGCHEWRNKNNAERAAKHWIIAASQGDDDAIKALMDAFKEGYVEKDILAAALRAHKAAVDATKSPERDEAEDYYSYQKKNNLC